MHRINEESDDGFVRDKSFNDLASPFFSDQDSESQRSNTQRVIQSQPSKELIDGAISIHEQRRQSESKIAARPKVNNLKPDKNEGLLKGLSTSTREAFLRADFMQRLPTINDKSYFENNDLYQQSFMKKEGNATDFLNAVKKDIPLTELYTVVKTCSTNEKNNLVAVLKQIGDKLAREAFIGFKYLLEIWNRKGELIYQRQLKHQVRSWSLSSFQNTFIYLTDRGDEKDGEDYFHVVHLKDMPWIACKEVNEVKIPDWTGVAKEARLETEADYYGKQRVPECTGINVCVSKERFVEEGESSEFGFLWVCDSKEIHVANLDQLMDKTSAVGFRKLPFQEQVEKVTEGVETGELCDLQGYKIHGFYENENAVKNGFIGGLLENPLDSLIQYTKIYAERQARDTVKLIVSDKTRKGQLRIVHKQLMEPVSRRDLNLAEVKLEDTITRVEQVFLHDSEADGAGMRAVTVVQRQSNNLDIYWNYKLIDSTDGDNYTYQHFDLNYEEIQVERKSIEKPAKDNKHSSLIKSGKGFSSSEVSKESDETNVRISLRYRQKIAMGVGKKFKLSDDATQYFIDSRICAFYKPYESFMLVGDEFFVAHSNIVTIFNLRKGVKHAQHIQFASDKKELDLNASQMSRSTSITNQFQRSKKVLRVFQEQDFEGNFKIAVLFQDGSVKLLEKSQESGKWETAEPKTKAKLQGTIIRATNETEHYRIMYVLTKCQYGKIRLYAFTNDQYYDFTGSISNLTEDTVVIPFFSPAEDSQVIVMNQKEGMFRILEHSKQEKNGQDGISVKKIQTYKFDHKLIQERDFTLRVHTAASTDLNSNIIFFDKIDMHYLDIATADDIEGHRKEIKTIKTFPKLFIQGVQLIQNRYLYCLHNEWDSNSSINSVGILDLATLDHTKELMFPIFPICNALVGVNNEIVYSEPGHKIMFLRNYKEIAIIPLLHENVINFEHMKKKSEYLATQQIRDQFVTLDKHGVIRSWCTMTGKYNRKTKVYGGDVKGYEIWNSPIKCKHIDQDIPFNQQQRAAIRSMLLNEEVVTEACQKCTQQVKKGRKFVQGQTDIYHRGHFKHFLLYQTKPLEDNEKEYSRDQEFYGKRLDRKIGGMGTSYFTNMKKKYHMCKVVSIQSEGDSFILKEHFKFVFPRLEARTQNLFFSADLNRMLEMQGKETLLYEVQKPEAEEAATLKLLTHLNELPSNLMDGGPYQLLNLMCPAFKRYIDFDFDKREFVVRDTEKDDVMFRIPKCFLDVKGDDSAVMEQIKFIAFDDLNSIRVVDFQSDENIEKIIKFSNDYDEEAEIQIEELGSVSIPMLDKGPFRVSCIPSQRFNPRKGCNYFKDELSFNREDVFHRLVRQHQTLKSMWWIGSVNDLGASGIAEAVENEFDLLKNITKDEYVYRELLHVDYTDDDEYLLELPFTFYNWRIIEKMTDLAKGNQLARFNNSDKLPVVQKIIHQVCLNILPNLDTVLHREYDNVDVIKFIHDFVQNDLELCGHCEPKRVSQGPYGKIYDIPFIRNLDNDTPLHLCLKKDQKRVADYFLSVVLPKMPIDHHGKAISDIIGLCFEKELASIVPYLEKRVVSIKQFNQLIRVPKMSLYVDKVIQDEGLFVSSSPLWSDLKQLKQRMFRESEFESENDVKVLDMPRVHNLLTKENKDLCEALANIKDEEIFQQDSIRAILNFSWSFTRNTIIWQLLLPYFFYAVIYFLWVSMLWDVSDEKVLDEYEVLDLSCRGILAIGSIYFLSFEIRQICDLEASDYLTSIWNYIDVTPPILILSVLALTVYDDLTEDDFHRPILVMQSISAFMMWMKMFYFLRVFRHTGYLVNMLTRVFTASKWFFLLYFLIHIAFAFTFLILTGKEKFFFYTYMIGMGEYDFEFDEYETPFILLVFFFGVTVLVNIVMLNLLIAIVSVAHEEVTSTQQASNDIERVQLLVENRSMFNRKQLEKHCQLDEYLVVAKRRVFEQIQKEKQE